MDKMIINLGERSQYDEFIRNIQQPKMKKIWNNRDDEVWDELKI